MKPKFRTYSKVFKTYFTQGDPDLETLQSFIFHYGGEPLEMSTGLRDINNKEIFEGDILLTEDQFFIVGFNRGAFVLDSLSSFYYSNMADLFVSCDALLRNYQIVGNAHQGVFSETHKKQFQKSIYSVTNKMKETQTTALFDENIQVSANLEQNKKNTCRNCVYRERFSLNDHSNKIIQCCTKRPSKRSNSGYATIRVIDLACPLFQTTLTNLNNQKQ